MVSTNKYLGFDLSTQQLKAIVINDKFEICHQVSVDFDSKLSEFNTAGGVHRGASEPDAVTAPVFMWLKAITMCLDELKACEGLDFSSIVCISGCAQQHGSVWWRKGAEQMLKNLDRNLSLACNLQDAFSVTDCPTWLDSSTTRECGMISDYLHTIVEKENLHDLYEPGFSVGSNCHERFTAPQIAKMIAKRPDVYEKTERITLISNFLVSILIGSFAPFDVTDAAGTNMMDIERKEWDSLVLDAIVSELGQNHVYTNKNSLRKRLGCTEVDGNIVESGTVIGEIAPYFQAKYSFSPRCSLTSMMGDTLSSMAGLCVTEDELVISLGTSDTACFWLKQNKLLGNGHLSRCPIDPAAFVAMIGFKNGSKTRERLRDKLCSDKSWLEFANLLEKCPPGNMGQIGFYFDLREIYPPCLGEYRFDKDDNLIEGEFGQPEFEVRACIEGQFLRLFNHLELDMEKLTRIRVTGGASGNCAILQIISDIFGKPVHTFDMPNSACLGAAYMAKYGYDKANHTQDCIENLNTRTFKKLIDSKSPAGDANVANQNLVVNPRSGINQIYKPMIERCRKLEEKMIEIEQAKRK